MAKRNRRPAPFLIPPVLTIRGKRWLVLHERHLSKSDYDLAVRRDLKKVRGQTDSNRREIQLARGQSPRGEAYTFLHELLHACSRDKIPSKHEEAFITDIERALLEALEQLEWRPSVRGPRFMNRKLA